MKFIVSIILIIILSFVASLYFPWWCIEFTSMFVALVIPQKPAMSFLAGFLGLFILWGGLSLWISLANEFLFAGKLSLLIIKINNPALIILITAMTGGLVGGFAALTGAYLRRIFPRRNLTSSAAHQM